MTFVDVCVLASVLVVVVVIGKMLRAIRLLDGRVTILQEQLEHSRALARGPAPGRIAGRAGSGRTPVAGVPVVTTIPSPRPTPLPEEPSQDARSPGEATTHVIEQSEVDAVWARLEAEQAELRQAMGRDFHARTRKRSASDVRGKPVARTLSPQELAKKLERR